MPTPTSPIQAEHRQAFYSTEQLPTSPKPENELWRGIIISAPEKTTLTRTKPMLLLCGFLRVQKSNYPKDARRIVIATDVSTKKEYAGLLGQYDSSPVVPPPPRQPPDPEILKRMVTSHYFNSDLMSALGLPWANATYKVRMHLGDLRSNEITAQVFVE